MNLMGFTKSNRPNVVKVTNFQGFLAFVIGAYKKNFPQRIYIWLNINRTFTIAKYNLR